MLKDKIIEMLCSPYMFAIYGATVWALIVFISEKTTNKIDDKVVALIKTVFCFVEKGDSRAILLFFGIKPDGYLKINNAMTLFISKYKSMYGSEPPQYLKDFANRLFAEMAFELKKNIVPKL
jgi:hypothetical protein